MTAVRTILILSIIATAVSAAEIRFVPGVPTGPGVTGASAKGELVGLTDKELTWRDENNNTAVQPIQAVLDIDLQPAVALPNGLKYTDVELTDGSLLHCSRFAV